MSKELIKENYFQKVGEQLCAYCGKPVSEDYALVDTDRKNPKASGGEYNDENVRVMHPWCHMKRHENYRVRSMVIEELKALVDERFQILKLRNKIANQLLAFQRQTDHLSQRTENFLKDQLETVDSYLNMVSIEIKSFIGKLAEADKLTNSALNVKGLGELTLASCLVYIDLEKANHASSLWAYVGLDKASHSRYNKNEASGGNKTLRTQLYTMADSQVKTRGAYRSVYDNEKKKKENSEEIVKTRNTQGKLEEKKWKDTKPSHRHGHALRMVIKHFLADYWFVGRTIFNLPTNPIYAEAVLKNGHKTIMPEERGWKY